MTIFKLLGFKVRVDLSWLFLALLVAWSLARGLFPGNYPGFSSATYWWMGVAGSIGLFFSIVFHELSHSVVARHFGIPIKGITLFIFGGVAEMEDEPPNARAEFLMAIAGPIASALLAAAFYGLAAGVTGRSEPAFGVIEYLAWANSLLALFNLVPAFPLDGGRVLRAALWYWRGNLNDATRTAANAGSAFGLGLIALGVIRVLSHDFVGGMWWFLIGMFLRSAAGASYQQLRTRQALEGEPVARFMTRAMVTIPPEASVRQLVEDYIYRYHHEMFPVTEDGRLLGCVTTREVKAIPKEQWDGTPVAGIMQRCSAENAIAADEDAMQALSLMQRTGNSRLMVRDGDRLVGIITLKDLLKLLALKLDLEGMA